MTQNRKSGIRKVILKTITAIALLFGLGIVPKYWISASTASRVFDDVKSVPHRRVALILGAKVYKSGNLSPLLRDRVDKGIELYKAGRVEKLLLSGDNRFEHYNEPDRMAEYAINHGVNPKDIVRDYAGRRTYDSVYRAKHIFGLDEMIVISQRSHAQRALFICDRLGIKAYGLAADVSFNMHSAGGTRMLIREFPASMLVISDLYFKRPHPVMGGKEKI